MCGMPPYMPSDDAESAGTLQNRRTFRLTPTLTVDPLETDPEVTETLMKYGRFQKLEHGCRMIHAGFPFLLLRAWTHGHVLTFWNRL